MDHPQASSHSFASTAVGCATAICGFLAAHITADAFRSWVATAVGVGGLIVAALGLWMNSKRYPATISQLQQDNARLRGIGAERDERLRDLQAALNIKRDGRT